LCRTVLPENGFISLNAPLTTRRIGSLSTRTTHPYFLGLIQEIFNEVGIECDIINPYQFQTKGEMLCSCRDQNILQLVFQNTVSCSHWKRKNKQCGRCVPCIIRRSALKKADFNEQQDTYIYDSLKKVLLETDKRDDLRALSIAIDQLTTRPIGSWILNSGPLPHADYNQYQHVFVNGLKEVEVYLQSEGVL
jgi:Queuosine biosynthesis protein QueC